MTLPALAQDGSIADRTTLLMPSPAVERLALPSRSLLKHKERAAVLDKLSSVRSAPTVQMLLDAFADDGGNFTALHPRLQQFTGFTEPGDDNRLQLAKLPIIPLHGSRCFRVGKPVAQFECRPDRGSTRTVAVMPATRRTPSGT